MWGKSICIEFINLNQNILFRAEQKDRVDSSRYMDNSHYMSDNMPLSAPPVNAG